MTYKPHFFSKTGLNYELACTGVNVVFCLLVAGLITSSGSQQNWWSNLQISFGYGLPVQFCMMAVGYTFKEKTRPWQWALGLFFGLCIGSLWAQYVIFGEFNSGGAELKVIFQVFLSGVGFSAVALIIHFGYSRQAAYREQLWQMEREQLAHGRELAQAELRALQAQIEPHFLFNALANLQALIAVEPTKAEKLCQHLSELLRSVLHNTRGNDTTLAQELHLVRAYLNIQQIRLGERLQFTINAPDDSALDFLFPPLMLQPLVENAVTHGIEPSLSGGEVNISVSLLANSCLVQVLDTGVGLEGTSKQGHGIGVENIRARLRSLHQSSGTLQIESVEPRGTVCNLEVPVEN